MEVDRVEEVLLITDAASRVLDPLNLRVDRLATGVGNAMPELGDDVFKAPLHHSRAPGPRRCSEVGRRCRVSKL